jgi:S1-C subfamily serine protease
VEITRDIFKVAPINSHRLVILPIVIIAFILSGILPANVRGQVSLAPLVKKIQPSVVTITTFNTSGESERLGSGFFVNKDGLVVTNYHVVEGAYRIIVETSNGTKYNVRTVIDSDKNNDLASLLVDIRSDKNNYLKISAVLPEPGDRVMVIGSPLGLEQTVSDGVVSAIRNITKTGEILQISAPISPGSSGGPVVNLRGEVIGVATFQIVAGQNLNFAIPGYRVLAIQKRSENIIEEQYVNKEKEQKQNQGSEGGQLSVLYKDYYNKGISALQLADLKRDKEKYNEAIRSLKLALMIKSNDLLARQALTKAESGLDKLKGKSRITY